MVRHGVKFAVLYGSVALGMAGPDSDLDLMIVASRDIHEALAQDLYRIGARYDLTVSPYLVEGVELKSLDPRFLEAVKRDGIARKGELLGSPVE